MVAGKSASLACQVKQALEHGRKVGRPGGFATCGRRSMVGESVAVPRRRSNRPILVAALRLACVGFSAKDERAARAVDFAAGTLLFRAGAIPCFGAQNISTRPRLTA